MKKQLINIDFKKDYGLILKWNFNDLTKKNTYFRHIIVALTSNLQIAEDTIQEYIRCTKIGDLYAIIYCTKANQIKRKVWREKTVRTMNSETYLINQQLSVSFKFEHVLSIIQNQISQSDEPTILNFIVSDEKQVGKLKKRIRQKQVQNKIRFISNIISPGNQNQISIHSGINVLSYQEDLIFEFYHKYINTMAIEFAHLVITCRNGQINSCNQDSWKNTSFSKLQRSYYGPSIQYIEDQLHFVNTKHTYVGVYDLDISLSFKCFGGKVYTSQKKIAIHFGHTELYTRTVSNLTKNKPYYSPESIQIYQTPFFSETLVIFELGDRADDNDL